jgi:hypothetical protein
MYAGALTVVPFSYEEEPAQPASSTQQHPRLHDQLKSQELAVLSEKMLAMSELRRWERQVDTTGHEETILWEDVLGLLVGGCKASYVDPFETHNFLGRFTYDELEEWKNGLRKAVKEKDWTDLIDHRMSRIAFENLITSHHCDSETSKERTIYVHRGNGSTN